MYFLSNCSPNKPGFVSRRYVCKLTELVLTAILDLSYRLQMKMYNTFSDKPFKRRRRAIKLLEKTVTENGGY